MPLYKKKPFPVMEPPQDLNPDELVYQIRFTKEMFRDYQEYLYRLNFYRQRIWACKITGKTNLTYEEALVSESRAVEKAQQLPKELTAHVLCMIQYSTLNLKDLIDVIYNKLQEHLFEGLELHGNKDQAVCTCKILKILEDGNTTQYEVGWLDKDKKMCETSVVKAADLTCKKPPCSRSMLKAFIRESTSRSAPWVIHEKLAQKHGISTVPPADLADKSNTGSKDNKQGINNKRKDTENGMVGMDMNKKRTKKEGEAPHEEPIKYPIDDLLVRPAAGDPSFSDRPPLSTEFKVPMDCVGDLLMIWEFFSSFAKLLNLWRFSLEDFENALCHKDSNIVLIVESHAALLRLLIKDEGDYSMLLRGKKRKSKITLITWTEYLCDFLDMEDRAEFSEHTGTIKRGHYGILDVNIKVGILRELVAEAFTTNAVRARLDECIEQQQALAIKRREENRRNKEEQHLENGMSEKHRSLEGELQNGNRNICNSDVNNIDSLHKTPPHDGPLSSKSSKRNHVHENGGTENHTPNLREMMTDNRNGSDKVENGIATNESKKGQRGKKHKDKDAQEKRPQEEQKVVFERELERLSIRTNYLAKDRSYNRYWFFCREGRLFVESSDSKLWGYYMTKEELDALMASLNPKGERERALQRQLEKQYQRISTALQKRSKEAAQKALLEEGELRRSTRVRAQPREKPAFFTYVNKWKDD